MLLLGIAGYFSRYLSKNQTDYKARNHVKEKNDIRPPTIAHEIIIYSSDVILRYRSIGSISLMYRGTAIYTTSLL